MTKKEIKEFSRHIEIVASNNNISLIDAIVDHCENNKMELEVAAKMITPKLKKQIKLQAIMKNQLKIKKKQGLPI